MDFPRIKRLPPYVFNAIGELCLQARRAGEDVIDFGMGNPDGATPPHIVNKMVEAATKAPNHRYSVSRGVYKLRLAIADWYRRRYNVEIDPDSEAIATIGSKEGIGHMALAILDQGDVVLAPTPTYPIHKYGCIIAGAQVQGVPLQRGEEFFEHLTETVARCWPRPKFLIMSFPHNPTTATVPPAFMRRVVEFARENEIMVAHDFAYADLCFDGYRAPSLMEVPGAREIGVEFFTLSKSYNMPGWRVGFAVGNAEMIGALSRLKSYFDYGMFAPVQVAAIHALNGPQDCVGEIVETYRRRRDVLIDGLNRAGWPVEKPRATMFVWAPIPEPFRAMGSLEFSKFLLTEAKVAVSPGVGFGADGDGFVRFALIENEHRIRQACRGIRHAFNQRLGTAPGQLANIS
ncbi:MAG: aminotransferase class I/II-fold pyridoxal phosphate-dependent enzyme [Candidatus Binataceae bacterium]|nr:aminotransferase class I/II-fold pyridoxal phosphate-dependent enzyme [Candidatus Binataceae bacterium]